MVLQGNAVVTAPGSDFTEIMIPGSLLLATDTADVSKKGHSCYTMTETVIVQIPTEGNEVPGHIVLSDNAPCKASKNTNEKISLF